MRPSFTLLGFLGVFVFMWPQIAVGVPTPNPNQRLMDPRCAFGKPFDIVVRHKSFLNIKEGEYIRDQAVVCDDEGVVLPDLTPQDDWLGIFTFVRKMIESGEAANIQFPQIFSKVHVSLDNPKIFQNCSLAVEFCELNRGCPHVHPMLYSSRAATVEWAIDMEGRGVSRCEESWMADHIGKAKNDKESWIIELQTTCASCFRSICNSPQGREVYDDYLYEISTHYDVQQPQHVMEKICITPSALGYFSFKNFHLQRRFNTFEPELSIKLRLQNIWYIVYPSLVSWIFCVHILLYCFPHCKANIFNRHLDEELKEKNDPFWNYLIKRIATKPIRMQQKKMRRKMAKKLKRKRSHMKKCHPAPTWKLATGKVIGQKFGPLGRGGRKKA